MITIADRGVELRQMIALGLNRYCDLLQPGRDRRGSHCDLASHP
jgi:hypothetical protein